jgi:hypothetical protein
LKSRAAKTAAMQCSRALPVGDKTRCTSSGSSPNFFAFMTTRSRRSPSESAFSWRPAAAGGRHASDRRRCDQHFFSDKRGDDLVGSVGVDRELLTEHRDRGDLSPARSWPATTGLLQRLARTIPERERGDFIARRRSVRARKLHHKMLIAIPASTACASGTHHFIPSVGVDLRRHPSVVLTK